MDTLTKIAEKFGTTPQQIAEANNIPVNSVIIPGQTLSIPETVDASEDRFVAYRVRKGDRLSDIASQYGTTIQQISRDNDLKNANQIKVGQTLKIRQSSESPSAAYRVHRVAAGDSLSSIAEDYGVTPQDLLNVNRLKNPNLIKSGQLLRIPTNASGKVVNPANDMTYDVRRELARLNPTAGKWKRIMIHHTATPVGSFKAIDNNHRNRGMSNGMAYHFLIGNGLGLNDGEIVIGPRWLQQIDGGHTSIPWLNATSIGICLVGDFENSRPTSRQLQQLSSLCRFLMAQCAIPKSNLITHKMAYQGIPGKSTACPGRNFSLDRLKKDI